MRAWKNGRGLIIGRSNGYCFGNLRYIRLFSAGSVIESLLTSEKLFETRGCEVFENKLA